MRRFQVTLREHFIPKAMIAGCAAFCNRDFSCAEPFAMNTVFSGKGRWLFMKKARLLPALVLALLFLLPAGCGTRTASAAQPTPAPAETVTASGTAGTLRVQVPDGWKYEVCPEGTLDGSETDFGVKLWPDSGSDSCVQLYWSDSFGVCGTGLKEETLTLAGDSVSAGYYDGDKNWTFLSFQGKNRGIVAWADPNAGWFADKGDQLLAVLDTVEWEPAA